MLSRKVCAKCWGNGWGVADKHRWDARHGEVFCNRRSPQQEVALISNKSGPPPWCQYKMEHAVIETLERANAV
jgi:hypothetical protein